MRRALFARFRASVSALIAVACLAACLVSCQQERTRPASGPGRHRLGGEDASASLFSGFSPPMVQFREKPLRGKATGFVHLEQLAGSWWLVDPDGETFWSTGVCASGGTYEEPYLRGFLKRKYGDGWQSAYVKDIYPRLLDWHFNSFGCWSRSEFKPLNQERLEKQQPYLFYFEMVHASELWHWAPHLDKPEYYLTRPDGRLTGIREHTFVDPWNREWRKAFDEHAREITTEWRGRRDLAAYFLDNENGVKELYHAFFSPACGKAFLKFLRGRYHNDIARLRAAWGRGILPNTFDEIVSKRIGIHPKVDTRAKKRDYLDFMERTVLEYSTFVCETMRKYDPDHLLISNRQFTWGDDKFFALPQEYRDMFMRIVAGYAPFDVLCQNLYPFHARDHYSRENLAYLGMLHEASGLPVLIGEFGVTARDSGIDSGLNAWDRAEVDTQTQRGLAYRCIVHQAASLPFVVGAHWFAWADGYGMTFKGRHDRRERNMGLVDSHDEPYRDFVKIVAETNKNISRMIR